VKIRDDKLASASFSVDATEGTDLCQFLPLEEEVAENSSCRDEGASLLSVSYHHGRIDADSAFSIPIDYISPELEIESSQFLIHLTVESDCGVQMALCPSLYERTSAVTQRGNFGACTSRLKKYNKFSGSLISAVIDTRALRRLLVSEAVRHKKIKKYNPRQYAFFNLYIIGRSRVRVAIYNYGVRSSESGFRLYMGPTLVKGKEIWGCYSGRDRQDASSMTDPRLKYVYSDPELFHSKDVYEYFPPVLLTTLKGLMPLFHRIIQAKITQCPVHEGRCGVSFRNTLNPLIFIPDICYNVQPDLNSYIIMWLNKRYKRRGESWWNTMDLNSDLERKELKALCRQYKINIPLDVVERSFLFFIT